MTVSFDGQDATPVLPAEHCREEAGIGGDLESPTEGTAGTLEMCWAILPPAAGSA